MAGGVIVRPKDLYVEGLGVAMLDMQLDTRESHELGYASLKSLTVGRPGAVCRVFDEHRMLQWDLVGDLTHIQPKNESLGFHNFPKFFKCLGTLTHFSRCFKFQCWGFL